MVRFVPELINRVVALVLILFVFVFLLVVIVLETVNIGVVVAENVHILNRIQVSK